MRAGLRSALGTRRTRTISRSKTEPHDRGSILVAAVFDAYFTIYTRRTANLFRIYRAGGGQDNPTDLPGPLADRLAAEASRTAEEFFTICARALDYCPPVDITFGDFLRAIITADLDLHPSDPDGVRDALMQAFRLRGIVVRRCEIFLRGIACAGRGSRTARPSAVDKGSDLRRSERPHQGGKGQQRQVLRAYAKASSNAELLGFDAEAGRIEAASFHPMFHLATTAACSSTWWSSWCKR